MDLRYCIEVQNALILLCLCVTAITSEDTRFVRSIANHERQSSLSSSYGKDTQLHIRKKRGFVQFLTEDLNARPNIVPGPPVSDFKTGSETSSGSGSKSSGRSSQSTRGSGSQVPGRIVSNTRRRGSRPGTTRIHRLNKGEVRRSRMRGPRIRGPHERRLGSRGSHIGVHQSSGDILRGQGMGVHGPRTRGPHGTGMGADRHGITMGDGRGPRMGSPYSGGMGRRPRIGGPSGPGTRGPEMHGPEEPRGGMYRGREMGGGHRHRMGEYPGSQMGDPYGRGIRPNNLGIRGVQGNPIGGHEPRIPGVEGIPFSPSLGGYVPGISGIEGPMGGLFDGTSVGGAISGPGMGGAYRPEERVVDRPGRGGTHRRRRRRFRG